MIGTTGHRCLGIDYDRHRRLTMSDTGQASSMPGIEIVA